MTYKENQMVRIMKHCIVFLWETAESVTWETLKGELCPFNNGINNSRVTRVVLQETGKSRVTAQRCFNFKIL